MVKFGSLFGSLSVCVPLSENLSKICNVVDNAECSSLSLNIQPKPMCAFSLFLCQHKNFKCKTSRDSFNNLFFKHIPFSNTQQSHLAISSIGPRSLIGGPSKSKSHFCIDASVLCVMCPGHQSTYLPHTQSSNTVLNVYDSIKGTETPEHIPAYVYFRQTCLTSYQPPLHELTITMFSALFREK